MMQDRFVKLMLVLIAGLLAANLMQPAGESHTISIPSVLPSANAQVNATTETTGRSRVSRLEGFSVEDLQSVVAVGDGRSFVVSNPKGFMVYQVVTSAR